MLLTYTIRKSSLSIELLDIQQSLIFHEVRIRATYQVCSWINGSSNLTYSSYLKSVSIIVVVTCVSRFKTQEFLDISMMLSKIHSFKQCRIIVREISSNYLSQDSLIQRIVVWIALYMSVAKRELKLLHLV